MSRRLFKPMVLLVPLAVLAIAAACGGGGDQEPTPTPSGPAKRVDVQLKSFAFVPKDLTFQAGETVEFVLKSTDIEHTFTVQGLPIDWFVGDGKTVTRRFTFDKAGEFRVVCTIPGHEAAGMVGKLTVGS